MSDYEDFKNESKHNEMMLAIEGYALDEVEKAVAAERARCAEIVRKGKIPPAKATWQEITMKERDINRAIELIAREIEGGSDAEGL